MSQHRFALGAVVGMLAGVIAGMLTAPRSGREARADIKHKARELKDKANQRRLACKSPRKVKES